MIPNKVKIVEVGPRDGLQNEKDFLPTEDKINFIKDLISSGVQELEVTSFVRPDKIPQLKDAAKVYESVRDISGNSQLITLVPNLKGFEVAKDLGVKRVALFTAVSEKFNQKNINSSIDESIKNISLVANECHQNGISIRGYISTVFGCPYEGKKTSGNLEKVIKNLLDMGADEISFGDTIGIATPIEVEQKIELILKYCSLDKIAMHFHDTFGRGLANVYAALKMGVTIFDSSAGGMGGCPYAKGASGNLATEDLVSMLNEMGILHGIDLHKITGASGKVLDKLGKSTMSKVHQVVRNAK